LSILWGGESDCTVWVIGKEQSPLQTQLLSSKGIRYTFTQANLDSIKTILTENKGDVAIQLPETSLLDKKEISVPIYHGAGNVSESVLKEIKGKLHDAIYVYKRDKLGLEESKLEELKFNVSANTQRITQNGSQQSSTAIAYGLGFMMNLLMYLLVVIYGSMIMQSVIEEKK